MLLSLFLIVAGLCALYVGGTAVVSSSVSLAYRLGVSTAVIGLTVVAFGTSAPEMAVGVLASLQGNPGIAVGNVFGSNIFNVLVAVGAAAAIAPLRLSPSMMRREVPQCVFATLFVILFAFTRGRIDNGESFYLLIGLIVFLVWTVRTNTDSSSTKAPDTERTSLPANLFCLCSAGVAGKWGGGWDWAYVTLAAGCVLVWLLEPDPDSDVPASSSSLWIYLAAAIGMLVAGAEILVRGSTDIGHSLGISEAIMGLTVVAIGTSAPELATSVIAAKHGESDLALGNALGSNLFNLLGVLGLAALMNDVEVAPRFVWFDGWLALASVLILPILGHKTGMLTQRNGRMLIATWLLYTGSLVVMGLA